MQKRLFFLILWFSCSVYSHACEYEIPLYQDPPPQILPDLAVSLRTHSNNTIENVPPTVFSAIMVNNRLIVKEYIPCDTRLSLSFYNNHVNIVFNQYFSDSIAVTLVDSANYLIQIIPDHEIQIDGVLYYGVYGNFVYPEDCSPTNVLAPNEDVIHANRAQKEIKNGRLLIITPDGEMYDVSGKKQNMND